MEAPLKDWEAGSHRQQSASTAASSTQTHILHSRIYCFPNSQCHRDSRHYFSWYPVNISWVLQLKQFFLSSSSALFIILIKNTPGVFSPGFSPATCTEICFQQCQGSGQGQRIPLILMCSKLSAWFTYTYWSVQDGLHDWSCYMRRKRMIFIHLSLLQPLFQLLIQLGSQRCWSLHQLALGKNQGVGSSAWKTEQFCRIILCIS